MDLNKLKTFTVVAELESMSRAAERLYRTQPAISNQLKDLEQELGLTLFERKKARIFLTKEGRELYHEAQRAFANLDDKVVRLQSNKQATEGLIRVAVFVDSISYLMPKLISGFREEFPKVRFDIVNAQHGEIDDLLLNNDVDFAMMIDYTKREHFETAPFFTFSRSLVAAPSYLSRVGAPQSLEDLAGYNLVAFYNDLGDFRLWLKKNHASQYISLFERQARSIVVNDAYTLNELLFCGVGIGFAFDNMAKQRHYKGQRLQTLFPHYAPIYGTVDLAHKKTRNNSYINEMFKQFVLDNKNRWRKI